MFEFFFVLFEIYLNNLRQFNNVNKLLFVNKHIHSVVSKLVVIFILLRSRFIVVAAVVLEIHLRLNNF